MEWQRVVELHGAGQTGGQHGSGYLLACDLVLTAKHVVEGFASVELRLLKGDEQGLPSGVGAWQPARVAWTSPHADLALLEPATRQSPFGALNGTATLARIDGRAPIRVHALGFPRAIHSASHSDTLHLEAAVNAWSGVRGESLLLDVRTTRPAEDDGWKGMSGAAVFAGDRLVGVVEAVPAKLDASTLRAVPVVAMFDDPAAAEMLRSAKVGRETQLVDAGYVDKLPSFGSWSETRERYAREVVTTFCSIDHLGLAVRGAPEGKTRALAAFTARRLQLWTDEPSTAR